MFFSLVFHNHQPVGQLPWTFEDAWRESYQPFLETLREFPAVKIGLHFSGPLLDWLAAEKPSTIALVRELIAGGQIELLCGGYYEPIFVIWPREDGLEQIARSQARMRALFDVAPRGLWLTERVWEPQLAGWFESADVKYTLLDGTLFEAAGIPQRQSHGFFQIEGSPLRVFPINRTLRDLIPWHEPHETIEYLRRVHEENGSDAHVLFGDDGEKFGAWPGTFEWVFKNGWLRRFFQALQDEAHWLQTVTPAHSLQTRAQLQNVVLESGSYPEMQEWAGGDWRHFLERYGESRDMHAEVLRARAATLSAPGARDSLLRAQSNDAYWHGVFGGLYLKHLRQAIYAECITAHSVLPAGAIRLEREEEDSTMDNGILRLGARGRGGHLFLLSHTQSRHNLLATLRRYREPYQTVETVVDWYPRGALLDHFFGPGVTPEEFREARFREEGDFIAEPWQIDARADSGKGVLVFRREGGVWHDGVFAPLIVEKRITLLRDAGQLQVEYVFRNPADAPLAVWWGMEWNTVLSGAALPERYYCTDGSGEKLSLQEPASFTGVTNPFLADDWLGLQIEWQFPNAVALWHAPIETVSQKEGGHIERIHQQSALVFHQKVNLAARGEYRTEFRFIVIPKK